MRFLLFLENEDTEDAIEALVKKLRSLKFKSKVGSYLVDLDNEKFPIMDLGRLSEKEATKIKQPLIQKKRAAS